MADPVGALVAEAARWPGEHVELLRRLLQNVVGAPGEAKFRRLKLANPKIAAFLEAPGARQGLEALGWALVPGGDALELPMVTDLTPFSVVLAGTAPAEPAAASAGTPWVVTVLRGPLRTRLELPPSATVATLAAAIEQSPALGHIPRARQQLLSGYPPRPIPDRRADGAAASLADLGVRSVMLEDLWESLVADLRAGKSSFVQLADALARPTLRALALKDYHRFVLERAWAMLRKRVPNVSLQEVRAGRRCLQALWPHASPGEQLRFCAECAASWITNSAEVGIVEEEDSNQPAAHFVLNVERHDVFSSTLSQVTVASPSELYQPLEVRFVGEAAEDAGGLRRELFNEFGRAAARADVWWQLTPAGALAPVPAAVAAGKVPDAAARHTVYRGCGRVFGMALCQAARPPPQPLLLGLPLARFFVRAVQGDNIDTTKELQAELNAEQHSNSPDFRGKATFLERTLQELGLEGQLSFSYPLPGAESVELLPGGRSILVTDETKDEWLRATLRYELVDSVQEAAAAFRIGVCEMVGCAHLVLLGTTELREAWSGRGVVTDEDLKMWKARTDVSPAVARQAEWLFELLSVGELRDARARVLKFATGSDRWPANSHGFKFVIEPMDGGDETLPCAMTCGNMLQLPRYSQQGPLRDRLLQAMDWGVDLHLA